jgi:predicted O-methyltransferase YrrM
VQKTSGAGCVVGTEYEPLKAAAARKLFAETGLSSFIDLREGDLRQTLRRIETGIDFVLIGIWIPMARPGLELVFQHLKGGRDRRLRQYRAIAIRVYGVFRRTASEP